MQHVMDSLPWWLVLLAGVAAGWAGQRAWWWVGGLCSDVAHTTRRATAELGKVLARLTLLGAVLIVGVTGLYWLTHLSPGN